MQERQSKPEHLFALAEELLADIELARLGVEAIVYKATRLARLGGTDETKAWLRYERFGYSTDDEVATLYLNYTGRWTNRDKGAAYWDGIGSIEALIATATTELQAMRTPDINYSPHSANPHERVTDHIDPVTGQRTDPIANALFGFELRASMIARRLEHVKTIRSKVLALVHDFAQQIYYEKLFSGLAESIFERYKSQVDAQLATQCGDVLEKIPSISDRLAEGDTEAVSQALTTCRRVLEAFADAVNPPSDRTIQVDGNSVPLDREHWRARVREHINHRVASESRRERLLHMLRDLGARLSAGVHADVALDEAKALLIHTYMFVGEIITVPGDSGAQRASSEGPPGAR